MKLIKGTLIAVTAIFFIVACAPPEEKETPEHPPVDIWGNIHEDKEEHEEGLEPVEESDKEVVEIFVFPGQPCPFDTEEIDYVCIVKKIVNVYINDGETCPEDTDAEQFICSTRETETVVLVGDDVCPPDTNTIHHRCLGVPEKYDFIHGRTAVAYSDSYIAHFPGLTIWGGDITGVDDSNNPVYSWAVLSEKQEAVEFIIYDLDERGRATLIATDLLITILDTRIELLDRKGNIIVIFLPETLEHFN